MNYAERSQELEHERITHAAWETLERLQLAAVEEKARA